MYRTSGTKIPRYFPPGSGMCSDAPRLCLTSLTSGPTHGRVAFLFLRLQSFTCYTTNHLHIVPSQCSRSSSKQTYWSNEASPRFARRILNLDVHADYENAHESDEPQFHRGARIYHGHRHLNKIRESLHLPTQITAYNSHSPLLLSSCSVSLNCQWHQWSNPNAQSSRPALPKAA